MALVWSTANGKLLVRMEGHLGSVWHATFLPDGQRILTTGADGSVRVYRILTLLDIADLLGK